MAAEVESMFSVREVPWHGLGTIVGDAVSSLEAIRLAGLDWKVEQRALIDSVTGEVVPGFVGNFRESDNKILGIVSDRYQVIQNHDAFKFADKLLGDGTTYETAGALFGGRKIWLLAKMPECDILGDSFIPYLVFTNSHDGLGAVRVAVTPVRVVCNNTLNLALSTASRSWACNHVGEVSQYLHEASKTLALTEKYMGRLGRAMEEVCDIHVGEEELKRYVGMMLPINNKEDGKKKIEHIKEMRNDILVRWRDAPDLSEMPHNGYRFMNAISDFAVHTDVHRDTKTFKENLFGKVVSGSGLYIDKAYDILRKVA